MMSTGRNQVSDESIASPMSLVLNVEPVWTTSLITTWFRMAATPNSLPWYFAGSARGPSFPFIDHEFVRESGNIVMFHGWEITEGKWVRKWAVFGKTLLQVGPLRVVKSSRIASIMPRECTSGGIQFQSKGVAAAFRKDFVLLLFRMVAPNVLPLRSDNGCRSLVVFGFRRTERHGGGHGAALSRIEPAIWTPSQAADHGVRVFYSESRQMNLWIAIRHVVAISIRIEQEIRRIENPNSAPPLNKRRGDVQPRPRTFCVDHRRRRHPYLREW